MTTTVPAPTTTFALPTTTVPIPRREVTASPPPTAKPSERLLAYIPNLHAEDIVGIQISAFAILALLGAAGTGGRLRQRSGDREAGELVVTEVESADEGLAALDDADGRLERGDSSWTWRWPGTSALDRASRRWPERIAHRSPLLARVINDAGYLRAMVGSSSLLLVAAGALLGVLAVVDVGGDALPPSFGLAVAMAVLGVFDALAGVVSRHPPGRRSVARSRRDGGRPWTIVCTAHAPTSESLSSCSPRSPFAC